MKRLFDWLVPLAFCVSACGSGAAKPPVSGSALRPVQSEASDTDAAAPVPPEAASEDDSAQIEEPAVLPTECSDPKAEICVPDRRFVSRLCMDTYPSLALVMFRKETPWARGYLTRETEAWNASGGAAPAGKLLFDEEVILLRQRVASGGIQVSGAGGGYDALRWDGSCVTLAAEEVTLNMPPRAKAAKITWRWIEPGLREVMKQDPELREAYRARRRECKGATMGEVSLKCVKADEGLGRAVEDYVRSGGVLPPPEKLP